MSELDALQTTLAGEHGALYVLGLLGSRSSQSAEPRLYAALRESLQAHRARRDQLISQISALGATPQPAAPAYVSPGGLETPEGRLAAALAVERACAGTYASLVVATNGPHRAEAIGFLQDAAVRALSFGGTPEIFPGLQGGAL